MDVRYGKQNGVVLWICLFVFLGQLSICYASSGDIAPEFQTCVQYCLSKCDDFEFVLNAPFSLRLFGWTCISNCKYKCTQRMTRKAKREGKNIEQFYGKWPFRRMLGIQEPASVLFSICNGLAHIIGWQRFKAGIPSYYNFYNMWEIYYLVNVNAWVWSTVFHCRDVIWTERFDYFAATSLVLTSIVTSFMRILGSPKDYRCHVFLAVMTTIFSIHVYYMCFINFSYGYNMKFNVAIGIINLIMWLTWCWKERVRRKYVWKCVVIILSVFFLVGLELGEFPPVFLVFDAHSLWHLSTIPFCYFWYSFILDDARFELQTVKKIE